MVWWHWFLIGAGSVILVEAILIGILYAIGVSLSKLANAID